MGAGYVIVIGDQSQKPQAGAGAQEVRSEGLDKVAHEQGSLLCTTRGERGRGCGAGARQPTASRESTARLRGCLDKRSLRSKQERDWQHSC
jgi:hypothetical protein